MFRQQKRFAERSTLELAEFPITGDIYHDRKGGSQSCDNETRAVAASCFVVVGLFPFLVPTEKRRRKVTETTRGVELFRRAKSYPSETRENGGNELAGGAVQTRGSRIITRLRKPRLGDGVFRELGYMIDATVGLPSRDSITVLRREKWFRLFKQSTSFIKRRLVVRCGLLEMPTPL